VNLDLRHFPWVADDLVWIPPLLYLLVMELLSVIRTMPWNPMSIWVYGLEDRFGPIAGRSFAWAVLIFLILLAIHLSYQVPLFGPRGPT
jgi:hypothetical protein